MTRCISDAYTADGVEEGGEVDGARHVRLGPKRGGVAFIPRRVAVDEIGRPTEALDQPHAVAGLKIAAGEPVEPGAPNLVRPDGISVTAG